MSFISALSIKKLSCVLLLGLFCSDFACGLGKQKTSQVEIDYGKPMQLATEPSEYQRGTGCFCSPFAIGMFVFGWTAAIVMSGLFTWVEIVNQDLQSSNNEMLSYMNDFSQELTGTIAALGVDGESNLGGRMLATSGFGNNLKTTQKLEFEALSGVMNQSLYSLLDYAYTSQKSLSVANANINKLISHAADMSDITLAIENINAQFLPSLYKNTTMYDMVDMTASQLQPGVAGAPTIKDDVSSILGKLTATVGGTNIASDVKKICESNGLTC
jgi:hypothetical protein